jgi:hypothetical protein
VELLVWTEPDRPKEDDRVTVFARLADNKSGVEGLDMTVKWLYEGRDPRTRQRRTWEDLCVAKTDARGIASCSQPLRTSRARIEVTLKYKGYPYRFVREF